MKKTLFFFVIAILCYVFARLFIAHKGYVLLAWGPYTLESSLWSFLFALVLCVVIVMLSLSLFRLLFSGISLFYPVTRRARSKKALVQATKGMIHYANGRWHSAQRLLDQAADAGQVPLITYLAAARAAHQNGDHETSANCLRKADKAAPGAELAIGITRAELLLDRGQREQALAILRRLYKKSPSHAHVLKLLKQNYQELKDWNSLAKLLPDLRKRKVITRDDYHRLHHQIYQALFEQAYQLGKEKHEISARLQPALGVWKSLSHHHKKDEYLLCEYARVMVLLGAEEEAELFIRQQVSQRYSSRLIQLYGDLSKCDQQKQLSTAESLLALHQNDPMLLLNLGKICMRCDLKGKAEEYFKRCLAVTPSEAAYSMMGQLLARQGLYEKSAEYFQQGASLANL